MSTLRNNLANGQVTDFEQFRRNNRKRVNQSLNKVLWICILAGPAIAIGVACGVFRRTSYLTCLIISLVMAGVAGGNYLILKKQPYSYIPGIFALAGVEFLLCYMYASHVAVRLTWFLIPLLSLLFCDFRVYVGVSVMNLLVMALGVWLEAPYYASVRTDFATPLAAFINVFAGCLIEAAVMFVAGYALGKATNNYYRKMIGQYAETHDQQDKLQEQLDILGSMAEIYDFVNLIDFNEFTEMSLREETLHKIVIQEGQDHTHMTQGLRAQIAPDMVDDFWAFTDITTVPLRLINRKSIAAEFISSNTGWFRAQYIRVKGQMDQKPEIVIYTIQNIDADKRREEHLIRISMTDELTHVFNRRCYDEDIAELHTSGIPDDLSLISVDVNGLKPVNDNLGHAAGDELIKGAATCLLSAVGPYGKVYRTGGDEFEVIAYAADCKAILRDIRLKTALWHGFLADTISVSVGYASRADYPEATVEDLEKIADQHMYEDKERYYIETGKERRHH